MSRTLGVIFKLGGYYRFDIKVDTQSNLNEIPVTQAIRIST
jgi:hypothetical protein